MLKNNLIESKHFTTHQLAEGVYACIHKPGGAAYSNAGIIDLGDSTLLVDSFYALVAGRDLRHTAEALFNRPVETIILTHAHSDHWVGASVFDANTTLLANKTVREVCLQWGEGMMEDFKNPAGWETWINEMEQQLQTEQDERVRVSLENTITRARYTLAEMGEFQPRYADQTFEDVVNFQGIARNAELRSLGRGHSEDDAVLLLSEDRIAFIGDIGFFDSQPFFGFCDIDLYREQLLFFQESEFQVLVPGHGPVGDENDIALQLRYFDVMEDLVSEVAQRGGSFEEALQVALPEPFDKWLVGGMERFGVNVRYLFAHYGGEVPEEE
ncbi:MAG: MBL fold metallo-hydrolase [Anaerolineaceae bacterium]|nr:MAG: MBL fold metallo-hydrolase [Anaerolineaceae bacterium]